MAKGRQKGQTKIMSKIKDEVIAPYELWIEEDQVVLMDTTKNKPMGYYGKRKTKRSNKNNEQN